MADDARLDHLLDAITALAAGQLDTPARVSGTGDRIDGIATALNMLAEELALERSRRTRAEGLLEDALTLYEQAPVGFVSVDPDGRIVKVNETLCTLLGKPAALLLGRPFAVVLKEEDRAAVQTGFDRIRRGEVFPMHDVCLVDRDGACIEASIDAQPQCGEDGQLLRFLIALRDERERKALDEALRRSERLQGLGRLAGGIAHDFNNVLSVVTLLCCVAMDRETTDDRTRADLKAILDASSRATDLTRQLLTFTRGAAAKDSTASANAVVREMSAMLERTLGGRIALALDLCDDDPNVPVGENDLGQILLNLAINARDAMPDGGDLTIRTGVDDDGTVVIRVSDDGTGMPPGVLEKMFDPFFSTKPIGQGTGLGLATAYGTVQGAGGTITATSEVGHGTTIEIRLPQVQRNVSENRPNGGPDTPKALVGTVLLVEDEDAVRHATRAALETTGLDVLTACDGLDGLAVARRHSGPIDVVVTDVVMPNLGGPALATQLRDARPEIRVLFISGFPGDHLTDADPDVGVLQKPVTPSALVNAVAALLS